MGGFSNGLRRRPEEKKTRMEATFSFFFFLTEGDEKYKKIGVCLSVFCLSVFCLSVCHMARMRGPVDHRINGFCSVHIDKK